MSVVTETGKGSSIFRAFEQLVDKYPNAIALFDGDETISRGNLLERALQCSTRLSSLGLREGDLLAIRMRNSTELVATIVAALRLRLTILPIDRDARATEISNIVRQFGARAITRLEGGGPETTILEDGRPQSFQSTALIKLTSGSTGGPRGVLTTEENLIADCTNICETMDLREDDVNLGAIPFTHSYGFSNLIMPLLLQGTSIVISNDYMPVPLLELSNRDRVTFLPGIPMMYDHLSRLPSAEGTFETVRTFISAGAPLTPAVARAFHERHHQRIHTFYGCSECGGITYDRCGGAAERGTVGAPMSNVDLDIDSETGRLIVRGSAVANGYWNVTDEEKARFRGSEFTTDDIVETTPEGEIRIVGRSSALINVAGKKVNPREVENVILTIDGVREVSVVGSPAGARGDVVLAVIVAEPGVSQQIVRRHCQEHLSAHKVPRIVRFIDQMPVDQRGKVRKSELL